MVVAVPVEPEEKDEEEDDEWWLGGEGRTFGFELFPAAAAAASAEPEPLEEEEDEKLVELVAVTTG